MLASDLVNFPELANILARMEQKDGYPGVIQAFIDEHGFTPEESIR